MARRFFSREYKPRQLVREQGMTAAEAARDLGLHGNVVRRWVQQFKDDPQHAFPGRGQQKPEQAEIAQLKREIRKLKTERDILKKAAAYFAKESN